MTRYVLDTNIVSFLVKRKYPALDRRVLALSGDRYAISSVVEAELRFGLALAPDQASFRPLTEDFLREVNIQPWDSLCAERYAELAARQQRLGKPLSNFDTMIAAHALAYGFILVTNDAAFRHIKGLKLEDWTKGPQRA